MASKNGSQKSLQEKFKHWIKGNKSHATGSGASHHAGPSLVQSLFRGHDTLDLTPDIINQLGHESPIETRKKVIRDLTQAVRERQLKEHGVELLWVKTKDLLDSKDPDNRRVAMFLLVGLVVGQYQKLDVMRAQFFKVVEMHSKDDDLEVSLMLLEALTKQGKDILHFEEKIGPFLLRIFPDMRNNDHFHEFLEIVLNMIKFNPAYLDPEIVCGLIQNIGQVCIMQSRQDDLDKCLECLYAIMGYSYIPREALSSFIRILCYVVNIQQHCDEAWRIMSSLMATHLGHSALYNLCQLMQQKESQRDVGLVRGSIFFIGTSLWGSRSIKSLENYSAMTILPTFISALSCNHYLVTLEIAIQLERLVMRRGGDLRAPGCDRALDLIEALLEDVKNPEKHHNGKVRKEITDHVHATITRFEQLSEEKKYRGSKKKLFDLIDSCAYDRPESSVIALIEYRASGLFPTRPAWITALFNLMEKYFKNDNRDNVRKRCLNLMAEVVKANRQIYEEELIERVVYPCLKDLDSESSLAVKLQGLEALCAICIECSSSHSMQLLDTYEKILSKPLEKKDAILLPKEEVHKLKDVRVAVKSLISIFKGRFCSQPASIVIRIYDLLLKHLENNYLYPNLFSKEGESREDIFRLLLAFRSDEQYHLGLCENEDQQHSYENNVRYSNYIVCRETRAEALAEENNCNFSQNLTYMSLTRACMLVIRTLREENDWNVLKMVLAKVPTVLQNKAIISRYGKAIHEFVTPLVDLTSRNIRHPEQLCNVPTNFSRSDFHNHVFPVLAALASYNEYLEPAAQKNLITALNNGLVSRDCNRTCIVALTTCALEMKKSMFHVIPQVLLNFSKISATKQIATPMLEFLSTLIRLPDIFSSFTDTNYMSVFAIALPFTNPFKFDAYTVSLAHHVIIMWFLKCKLAYRQNFVKFIIDSLNSNVIQSLEEYNIGKSFDANMDSALRRRSSSQGAKLALSAKAAVGRLRGDHHDHESQKSGESHRMASFHQELTETCVDILARYMFANTAVQPKRLPTANFLLKGGSSATWLLNTMIITVTTSLCDQTANRGGLCDRCHLICSKNSIHESASAVELSDARKRHQSEFQSQKPSPSRYMPGSSAKDDYLMQRQLDSEVDSTDQRVPTTTTSSRDPESIGKLESLIENFQENTNKKPDMCACWCTGWAEVYVRRPSGDTSWMCRIQNSSLISDSHGEFPLADLTNLFQPSLDPTLSEAANEFLDPTKRLDVQTLTDKQYEDIAASIGEKGESMLKLTQSPVVDAIQRKANLCMNDNTKHDNEKSPTKVMVQRLPSAPETERTSEQLEDGETFSYDIVKDDPNLSLRQNCSAIPEQSEEELVKTPKSGSDLLRRRTSLQWTANEGSQRQPGSPKKPGTPPTSGLGAVPLRLSGIRSGFRDRAQTVSGPSPRKSANSLAPPLTTKRSLDPYLQGNRNITHSASSEVGFERVTGISPQFVFLQLYHNACFGIPPNSERPHLLPATRNFENSIRNLDRIYTYETHKVGVLYIGPGQQSNETAILLNEFGSHRYAQFLDGLGSLISLKDVDKATTFLGGLDHNEGDGDFAYMWEDDLMQVIYHTATLMPNHENDPMANKKKRHIGNDFVAIVYNNSGGKYTLGTVKGQFIYACVVVIPLDQGSNKVFIECRPELDEPLGHVKEPKIVSDRNLAILVRQLALHCNLAAQIQKSLGSGRPYSSNCLERLRHIKRIREKILQEERGPSGSSSMPSPPIFTVENLKAGLNDFTSLVMRRQAKKDE